MRHRFAMWSAAAALRGAGCEPEPVDPCVAQDLALSLGTGVREYRSVQEGDATTVVYGPQGGWHIDVAGRLENTGEAVRIAPTFTLVETGQQFAGDHDPALLALVDYDAGSQTGDFFGVRSVVDLDLTPDFVCPLAGQDLLMRVAVTDVETDCTVVEEIVLVAVLGAGALEECPSE